MVSVLLLAGALSGCSSSEQAASDDSVLTTTAPTTSATTAPTTTTTTTTTSTTTQAPTTTTTTTTGEPAPPQEPTYGMVVEEQFTGMVPSPTVGFGALQHVYNFEVPANADRLVLVYSTVYTGLFSALVTLDDAQGNRVGSTFTECGIPPPGAQASFSCGLELEGELPAGEWTTTLTWQVGEVAEEYQIDVQAWGLLPA
jgi:hypothetical protein